MIYGYRNEKSFETADKKMVEQGLFIGDKIVDTSGIIYKINSIDIVGWATPFWGFSLFRKGRMVKVKTETSKIRDLSIDDLKELLFGRIEETVLRLGLDKDECIAFLKTTNSYKELIEYFC